ncbi:MAG TPA: LCP family protein [Mycobacteriales bacterium]|nr:LCP family protein [Mycobacteriales bacterium]
MTLDPLGSRPVGRRTARLAEKRRKRQRNTRIGAVLAGAALLVGAAVFVAGRAGDDEKKDAVVRTQRTVLLQVKGTTGTAVASALLAHDPAVSEGSVVLVPPQVIVSVPGFGSQPFGRALATTSVQGSRDALADLMGVTVDGSWVLDTATFAKLVDTVGGIQVDVDVPVMSGRTVLLQPGRQRLAGVRALSFGTYLAPAEQEQTRLARLQSVLDGLVGSLPTDVRSLLASLGRGSSPSLAVTVLADVLAGLKADDGKQQLQYRSLPVIKVDAGTDETRFRVDAAGTRTLVDELLAASIPAGVRSVGNRVLVLNGVGTPGLGEKVRAKLVPAGFVFVGSRNANAFTYARTQVLVKDATTQGAALGARVAQALGVPTSSVKVSDQIGTIADVVVIVGRDFRTA